MDNENMYQSQIIDKIPKSQMIYANIVHWITIISALAALFVPIFILADASNNILNPNIVIGSIFSGATPSEIWAMSSEGAFPGAHYYLMFPTKADSWALFFMNLGCAVGFFGLVPAVLRQAFKEKDWFCAILGAILALLIFLSMTGILLIDMG